ncbi:hypothetical protein KUC_0215 [Vreelandella boliviensis LC1]|nr:hypothetical protein KUC_0215 [Halomonas boliviensis LC1]
MGFGHDASVLKKPLHHAGSGQLRASCSEQEVVQLRANNSVQACTIPLVRKPGGLHVPD